MIDEHIHVITTGITSAVVHTSEIHFYSLFH